MGPTRLVSSSRITSRVALVYSADSTWRGVLSSSSVKSWALRSVTGFPDFCSTTVTRTFVEPTAGAERAAPSTETSAALNTNRLPSFINWDQSSAFRGAKRSIHQFTAQHGHGLSGQNHAVTVQPDPQHTAARGSLVGQELFFSQAARPVRRETAMGRASHRVFVHANRRREEAGNKVEAVGLGTCSHNNAPDRDFSEQREIGFKPTQDTFRRDFDQIIELVAAYMLQRGAQCFAQPRQRLGPFLCLDWKIHLNPIAALVCREQSAACVEPRLLVRIQVALLPECMRARQRGVAAQIHFAGWSEPAQVEPVGLAHQERGFREIHLACHVLHPGGIAPRGQNTDCRRITRERLGSESVDLNDRQRHERLHQIFSHRPVTPYAEVTVTLLWAVRKTIPAPQR